MPPWQSPITIYGGSGFLHEHASGRHQAAAGGRVTLEKGHHLVLLAGMSSAMPICAGSSPGSSGSSGSTDFLALLRKFAADRCSFRLPAERSLPIFRRRYRKPWKNQALQDIFGGKISTWSWKTLAPRRRKDRHLAHWRKPRGPIDRYQQCPLCRAGTVSPP